MAIPLIPKNIRPFLGKWRHPAPWESDDYATEYVIGYENGKPVVSGKDVQDGEAFVISDISWDGAVLKFKTLMPSTGREGLNEMRLIGEGRLRVSFTFTEIEEWHRVEEDSSGS